MRGGWFQGLKTRLSPNLFYRERSRLRRMKCEVQQCTIVYETSTQNTVAFKAGERESGVVYAKIPSLIRITETVSSHLGEGLYQEKPTKTLYCLRPLELTHFHGAAGGQNIGPGQSRGREA
jgi:hypothetical protein